MIEGSGNFDALEGEEPFPGVVRQSFSSGNATIARYTFDPHASFPLHSHPQEQVTLVERGSIEMTVAGERGELGAGAWFVVSPGVEHGITAGVEGARVIAVVTPRRTRSDEYTTTGRPT